MNRPVRPAALSAHLQYMLKPGAQRGSNIDNPLFYLLQAVREAGSISEAARTLGCSYRYAWGALKAWEESLGEPLVTWTRASQHAWPRTRKTVDQT